MSRRFSGGAYAVSRINISQVGEQMSSCTPRHGDCYRLSLSRGVRMCPYGCFHCWPLVGQLGEIRSPQFPSGAHHRCSCASVPFIGNVLLLCRTLDPTLPEIGTRRFSGARTLIRISGVRLSAAVPGRFPFGRLRPLI